MTSPDGDARHRRRAPEAGERRRDPERTRARIIDAAVAEFAAKGFAGARVGEIADRAGVNKQLISYYFGGKAGLYRAVGAAWFARESAGLPRLRAESLADMAAGYVAATPEARAFTRLLAWDGLTGTADIGGPEESTEPRMRAAMEDLRERQRDGELAAGLDPGCMLLALIAAAGAPVFLPQMVRSIMDADPESAEFRARYAEQIARLVRHLALPLPGTGDAAGDHGGAATGKRDGQAAGEDDGGGQGDSAGDGTGGNARPG